MRATTRRGVDLVMSHEGFSAFPYLCPAGWWTIGYGHTKGVTKATKPISKVVARELLEADLATAESAVGRLIRVELTDGQFDALVSFTFNLGGGALQRSTLRQKLNRGEFEEAADEFKKWVWGGGRKLPGLVRRRADERELFLSDMNAPAVAVENRGRSKFSSWL